MPYNDDVIVGVRLARIAALDPDGGVPATPQWKVVAGVSQVQRQYQWSDAQTIQIRGEDRLIAEVREKPRPVGVQLTLQQALVDLEALPILVGGTYTPGPPESWDAPRLSDPAPPGFVLEVYAAEYGEGSQHTSDEIGFRKLVYQNCYVTGGPDSTHQDRQPASRQLTVMAVENKTDGLPFEREEKVAALPA